MIAPIDCTGCLSNTGRNVLPLSVDFHTPPDVVQGPYEGYEALVYDEKIRGYVAKQS